MWKAEKPAHILIHLGLIAATILIIAFLFFKVYLPFTTNHNQKIVVPVLEGKSLKETEDLLENAGLRYFINDSSYVEGKGSGLIISQHPEAGSEVKKRRKIYLTVTSSQPPKVKMPELTDQSLKSAELTLKSFDLRIGNIEYVASPYKDLVISQMVKGSEVSPGTYVAKGTRIDLKVGNGDASSLVEIPYLVGLTKEEAEQKLTELELTPGIIAFDKDSEEPSGVVTKQSPDPSATDEKTISKGSSINLWVSE